jgi:hypothetical protein
MSNPLAPEMRRQSLCCADLQRKNHSRNSRIGLSSEMTAYILALSDVVVSGINCSPMELKCELSEGRKAKRVKRGNVELLDHRDQSEKPEKRALRDPGDGEAKSVLKDPKE